MSALRLILLVASLSLSATTVAQTTYRWVDKATGQTVFSDHPPPVGAKEVVVRAAKSQNSEPAPLSYAARVASEKFPVVLYSTKPCDEGCEQAKRLLSNRGIPFTEKSISTQEELAELSSKLGVKAALPCMTVGTQRQLGFESEAWNKLLDLAGYPKKSSAPAQ